ncbi:hypothetical protein [Verrucosispora sioxanthis]|uniref:hypothetical protein n=1 Tax=Verrucosispora sioxanthis TaxID=2499994 RepID=UPI001C126AC9|nr:hypothetical protein [Verrucosispora sioxanthis]
MKPTGSVRSVHPSGRPPADSEALGEADGLGDADGRAAGAVRGGRSPAVLVATVEQRYRHHHAEQQQRHHGTDEHRPPGPLRTELPALKTLPRVGAGLTGAAGMTEVGCGVRRLPFPAG